LIDLQLIEECRGGNFNNFRKLVEQTSPFAFSLAFRMLGDDDLAKDIVQETMVTIWQKLNKIRSAEAYTIWIRRVVINKCYDCLRNKKHNHEYRADDKTWLLLSERISQLPSNQLENEQIAQIISLLTDKLSPKQKTIFVLSEVEEMTSDEISEVTGMTKSTIKSNLYYARKSISEMIGKYL
jgi:RNA polymerase sigma-70 factor (ECF subfamily)